MNGTPNSISIPAPPAILGPVIFVPTVIILSTGGDLTQEWISAGDEVFWDDVEDETCDEDDGDGDNGCWENFQNEADVCRALSSRGQKQESAICWGVAHIRHAECLAAGGVHGIRTPPYWPR